MTDLKNEFSWSFSRHSTLVSCPRRYYFQHYASWGGWEQDAPPDVRELYRLKLLNDRPAWKGQILHAAIARALHRARDDRPVEDIDAYVEDVLGSMRQDYRDSRDDLARKSGRYKQHVRFFEHEEDPKDEAPGRRRAWKETAEEVERGLRNFFGSKIYRTLSRLELDEWLELEEPVGPPSAWELDGVRSFVKIDCAYVENGEPVVVDWKTGRSRSSLTPVQLAAYALYLADRHELDATKVRAREINVVRGDVVEHDVGEEALATFREVFADSVELMRSYLADAAANEPKPAAEFPFTEDDRACRWCHFRSACPKVSPAF